MQVDSDQEVDRGIFSVYVCGKLKLEHLLDLNSCRLHVYTERRKLGIEIEAVDLH